MSSIQSGKMGSSDFKPTQPKVKKGSIFDKLTDSSQYTGSHKNRFDSEGRGRGAAGRDLGALGRGHVPSGTVSSYPDSTNSTSIKKSPRRASPSKRSPSPKKSTVSSSKMGSKDFKPTQPKVKKGSIFDKLTDSSQYTGAHKHRFDASGKGRGAAGRDVGGLGGGTMTHSVSSYPERT